MRIGLRLKILLITVITPLSLGLAAWVTVNRNVERHVDSSSIQESLQHAASVFESMVATRGRALSAAAEVIARDPRFFSLLMLEPGQRDVRFVATVRGMARDFNGITQSELFEVMDRRGRRLASVGSMRSTRVAREDLVRQALRGKSTVSVVRLGETQFQVSATPVRADGRVVGVLLLGSEIGARLANLLRSQMRSEVTFVSGDHITVSTLSRTGDRTALMQRLAVRASDPALQVRAPEGFKLKGESLTYITLIRRIPGAPANSGQLCVMQRAVDPETEFLHLMQRDLALLAVVAVLAALLTGFILSSSIIRPIHQLVRGAREMQRGNYDQPIAVRGSDELGILADSFREMRRRAQVYVGGLEETARLKSEFITVASHELRTPLSAIQGYRDLLAAETLGPLRPKQKEALEAMKAGMRKLTQLADRATQFAQMKSERLEASLTDQPPIPVIERGIGLALAAAGARRVEVRGQLDQAPESFPLDGDLMAQAVANLVSNGIRFTPDGGRVTVRAREQEGHLEILVSDEGPGIPQDRLEHVFDHGYSVHDPRHHHSSEGLELNSRGLGWGLGITRGIVEAHGGRIHARNRPEGGSLFVMWIPRVTRQEGQRAA